MTTVKVLSAPRRLDEEDEAYQARLRAEAVAFETQQATAARALEERLETGRQQRLDRAEAVSAAIEHAREGAYTSEPSVAQTNSELSQARESLSIEERAGQVLAGGLADAQDLLRERKAELERRLTGPSGEELTKEVKAVTGLRNEIGTLEAVCERRLDALGVSDARVADAKVLVNERESALAQARLRERLAVEAIPAAQRFGVGINAAAEIAERSVGEFNELLTVIRKVRAEVEALPRTIYDIANRYGLSPAQETPVRRRSNGRAAAPGRPARPEAAEARISVNLDPAATGPWVRAVEPGAVGPRIIES
ncbi:MAG TPA: hypothetical protein VGS12_17685 [Caulobacteraceae bacterium]|nr:hypothetical protein [Caulobacteraceae bacterium]